MAEKSPTPTRLSPKTLSALEDGSIDAAEITITTPTNSHMIIAELVGTYILVFTGCGAIIVDTTQKISVVGISVVWGMAAMSVIYTLGHVSGAHINPSVTIAFAVSGKFPWRKVPMYIVTQLIGATLASMTLRALYKHVDMVSIVTKYSSDTGELRALLWEFILGFNLMFVICGVATDHRAINELSGVSVGAIMLLNVIIAGPTTGASMNPARSIGAAIVALHFTNLWVYIVAPTLGTIFATMVYSFIRIPVPDKSEETAKTL